MNKLKRLFSPRALAATVGLEIEKWLLAPAAMLEGWSAGVLESCIWARFVREGGLGSERFEVLVHLL